MGMLRSIVWWWFFGIDMVAEGRRLGLALLPLMLIGIPFILLILDFADFGEKINGQFRGKRPPRFLFS